MGLRRITALPSGRRAIAVIRRRRQTRVPAGGGLFSFGLLPADPSEAAGWKEKPATLESRRFQRSYQDSNLE